MYTKSADVYDAIYSWKNYEAEAEKLHAIIGQRVPMASTLLDVACGTGHHLELLRRWYAIEGLDIEPGLLEVARNRLKDIPLHLGDMRTFDLNRQFDVVTCLFSAIGYMLTVADMRQAVANMARHVAPSGLLITEPWLSPDGFDPDRLPKPIVGSGVDFNVVRIGEPRVEGRSSVMTFHYLLGTPGKVEHFTEEHRLGLYTPDEYRAAFEAAGLTAEFDEEGLMGRGLWIASMDGA